MGRTMVSSFPPQHRGHCGESYQCQQRLACLRVIALENCTLCGLCEDHTHVLKKCEFLQHCISIVRKLWSVAGERHLFGPLLMQSPNPRFLRGPFPVGDMDRPLGIWVPFGLGICPCFYFHWKKAWNLDGPATIVQ